VHKASVAAELSFRQYEGNLSLFFLLCAKKTPPQKQNGSNFTAAVVHRAHASAKLSAGPVTLPRPLGYVAALRLRGAQTKACACPKAYQLSTGTAVAMWSSLSCLGVTGVGL